MQAMISEHRTALTDIFYGVDIQLASISAVMVRMPILRSGNVAYCVRRLLQRTANSEVENHVQQLKYMRAEESTTLRQMADMKRVAEQNVELADALHDQLERFSSEQLKKLEELAKAMSALSGNFMYNMVTMVLSKSWFDILRDLPTHYQYCKETHLTLHILTYILTLNLHQSSPFRSSLSDSTA